VRKNWAFRYELHFTVSLLQMSFNPDLLSKIISRAGKSSLCLHISTTYSFFQFSAQLVSVRSDVMSLVITFTGHWFCSPANPTAFSFNVPFAAGTFSCFCTAPQTLKRHRYNALLWLHHFHPFKYVQLGLHRDARVHSCPSINKILPSVTGVMLTRSCNWAGHMDREEHAQFY
jgi:hypothetical protein